MDLDINDFELIPITDVKRVDSEDCVRLYDITVEDTNNFYVKLENSEDYVLMHNCDGSHITSMIIGLFYKYGRNLFDEGRICKLMTPLIISKDNKGKIKEYFFSVSEFKQWEQKNPETKLKHTYLKGLGSWEKDDLIYLIDKFGFEKFVVRYKIDENGHTYIEDWLGNNAEPRKEHLRHYSFDINKA